MDDGDVTEVFEDHKQEQIDEYETDSDDEESDYTEHSELVKRACVTRSGGAVRAVVSLDLQSNNELFQVVHFVYSFNCANYITNMNDELAFLLIN